VEKDKDMFHRGRQDIISKTVEGGPSSYILVEIENKRRDPNQSCISTIIRLSPLMYKAEHTETIGTETSLASHRIKCNTDRQPQS
jgi:hypothetical protein